MIILKLKMSQICIERERTGFENWQLNWVKSSKGHVQAARSARARKLPRGGGGSTRDVNYNARSESERNITGAQFLHCWRVSYAQVRPRVNCPNDE